MEPVDFGGESIVCGGDELYASTTLPSSVTQSGEVDLMGPVAFEGISPLHINLPFPYTMVSNATVTVYATNVNTTNINVTDVTNINIANQYNQFNE
jgi:hypothetical protein